MKQIMVMGVPYEIIQISSKNVCGAFKDSLHAEEVKKLVGENGENFAGLCDAHLGRIFLNVDLPYEKKKKTLLHEFVEAMDQECLLELEHTKMQSIANTLLLTGLLNVEELLKNEPEDIEISISTDSAG